MSRGPGRWQRAILSQLHDDGVVLTRATDSAAEQSAVRRAANVLAAAGRITLTSVKIEGANRLVAFPPGSDAPTHRVVVGLDGKRYRMPA